jgi:hypothetical protein
METPSIQDKSRSEAARNLNRALADRMNRWKWLRLSMAVVLAATGVGLLYVKFLAFYSIPVLLAAFIAFVLFLDARDAIREVNARKWNFPSPRMSRLASRDRHHVVNSPTS